MSVKYKDYYELLGVSRTASQDEISKAFKKLARKCHPDLNPNDKAAEDRFKEANEAYEVLKDPEKRKLYDSLGHNWKSGQDFQPPPGFDNMHFTFRGGGGPGAGAGGFDFSDFFESMFGGGGGGGGFGGAQFGGGGGPQFGGRPRSRRGSDAEAVLQLGLEEAYRGGGKTISLQEQGFSPDGRPVMNTRTLTVNVPPGVKDGQRIRLAGQGNPGMGGGPAGDLYLKVQLMPHPLYMVEDKNIVLDLPVAPWEAALGASVKVPTLDGEVELRIPPGMGSGRKLRLSGKGLGPAGGRGDMYVRVMIQVPKAVSDEQKRLWEELSEKAAFKPRNF